MAILPSSESRQVQMAMEAFISPTGVVDGDRELGVDYCGLLFLLGR